MMPFGGRYHVVLGEQGDFFLGKDQISGWIDI